MKFLVDSTAGKLCRWLRILGHDVRYVSTGTAGEMLSIARREGRTLLSRNQFLAERDPAVAAAVEADCLEDQLAEVGRRFPILAEGLPFTRCLVCNASLEPALKARARNRVPVYVYQTQKDFGYCPNCDKFYWKATHWEAMRATLNRVFNPGPPGF